MEYKALLIDLDGVIRHWSSSDEDIETAHGLPMGSIRKTAFAPQLAELAITGIITDEEWRKRTAEELRLRFNVPHATEAVAQWTAFPGKVDEKTLEILDKCPASLRIVLVTNATSRLPRDLLTLGLSERFYGVVNTSEVGVSKPRKEIFRVALKCAGVVPEQALFIDDTLSHVKAASALGILSHRFVGHDKMIAFLQQTKVLP